MVIHGDYLILSGTLQNGLSIEYKVFKSIFGDADTYDALYNHDNVDQHWKRQFDIMKEQGLLS